ncbi:MAG: sugar ABC transporter ATP-binding protein [Fastidiosipilaceae bacterium]|jgi:ABC-type sugar transport system ATPase subunit
MSSLVDMKDITVEFPGVKALNKVNFQLLPGEIHVLLGENGAGKSTLVKVLSGIYKNNSGQIYLNGKSVVFNNAKDAMLNGINIVHQELNLIPHLSVAENIFLGREPIDNGIINWKKIYNDTEEIIKKLKINIDPKVKLRYLSVAQKQMVEIAKCVSQESKVIIFDEPTSSLTDKEISTLFALIRNLKAHGVGIIYISHRLEEIKQIGDRVTILRDGHFIETLDVATTSIETMISLMVGRELKNLYPKIKVPIGGPLLEVQTINSDKLSDCSFTLRKGEILGLAGLMGAGRTELARAIMGADLIHTGKIILDGNEIEIKSPKQAVKHGIGMLPEERKTDGLILGMSVARNITLSSLNKVLKNRLINKNKEIIFSKRYIDDLNIKTPSATQKVKFLSGGNQQKVVIGKWLMTEGKVLIFDEPTRGIDVGAKQEIYRIMCELAKQGMGIIMISSDLPEILGMSDRILVMCEGKIVGEFDREEASQTKIMNCATGGNV